MPHCQRWSEEQTALVVKLWGEGRSSGEIVQALHYAYSRNAVIGKAHRLKLARREPRKSVTRLPRPPRPRMPKDERKRRHRLYQRNYVARLKSQGKRRPRGRPKEKPTVFWTPVAPINLDNPPLNTPLLATKPNHCRYIQAGNDECCDHPSGQHPSWCDYHHAIVFRREDEAVLD